MNKLCNSCYIGQLILYAVFAILVFISCSESESSTKQPVTFNLNHFYISIDGTSFEAFRDHPEIVTDYFEADSGMPEFRPVTDSTNVIYLRGKTVYMELMGPENRFGVPEGVTGIGFSEDTQLPLNPHWEGRIDSLFDGMGVEFGNSSYTVNGDSIRWYDTAYIPDTTTTIYTWYSRYNPEFLHAITGKSYSEYRREDYLGLAHSGMKNVQDISGLSLVLNPDDFNRLSRELKRIGAGEEKIGDGSRYRVGNVVFELFPSNVSRLNEVQFHLAGPSDCDYQAGNISLRCDGNRLRMLFHDE